MRGGYFVVTGVQETKSSICASFKEHLRGHKEATNLSDRKLVEIITKRRIDRHLKKYMMKNNQLDFL